MAILSRIRLELGRTSMFPRGSSLHGYELIAPLDAQGRVDPDAWRHLKQHCGVRRFWGDEKIQLGMLRHVGHGWRLDYGDPVEADEPFFKLDKHVFRPGHYVSISEADGVLWPFRVVEVSPVSATAAAAGAH